jgi:ribonuclease HII
MDQQLSPFEDPHYSVVLGTDEAGRGPLAGPVCAAAVVLPADFPFGILDDSKKLSEKKRLAAEPVIKEKAVAWAVAWSTPREIDEINILRASMLAMRRACLDVMKQLEDKGMHADIVLADGNKRPFADIPCEAIVKGDAKVHEIMAASILAKTARDAFMERLRCAGPCTASTKTKATRALRTRQPFVSSDRVRSTDSLSGISFPFSRH